MPVVEQQSWAHLWHTLRQSSRPHISWSSAIWRGALVGLCVTVGALTGNLEFGAAVGFGMLGPAMLPTTMPRVDIVRVCVVLTVLVPVLGLIAILLADSWWLLLFLAAAGYIFGCIPNAGAAAAMLSVPAFGASIALSATAVSLAQALWSGVFLFVGSLIGSAIALASWRFERRSELRKAIGVSLSTLEKLVREGGPDGKLTLVSASALSTSAIALSQAKLTSKQHNYLGELLQTANKLRLTLSVWVLTEPEAAPRLAVAEQLSQATSAFKRKSTFNLTLPDGLPPEAVRDLTAFAEAVNGNSQAIVVLPQSGGSSTQAWLGQMVGLLSVRGPVSRQGFRLALAMAAATFVWLLFGIGHGYWIAMAVAMVLKADYVTTLTKGLLRIAGTCAAVIVLAIVLEIFGNSAITYCILMIISVPFMIHWILANYFFASVAVASTMLLLSEAVDPGFSPVGERLLNTVIGSAIALVAFLLIPVWRGDQLPDTLRQLVQYLREWVQLAGDPAGSSAQVRAAAMKSRLAMTAASPIVDAALIEPRHTAYRPSQGLAIYVAAEGVGLAALGLELEIAEGNIPKDSQLVQQAHQQVLDDLDVAIETLNEQPQESDRSQRLTSEAIAEYPYVYRLADRSHQLRIQTETFWRQ